MAYAILLGAFAALFGGAVVFTNAVEWAGARLGLGAGAVGSILAAVATALPESVIPVLALIGGGAESHQVAIGSIVGAPFMLATVAMALVGVAALGFASRRDQGRRVEAHPETVRRDFVFFLPAFALAFALGLGTPFWARAALAGTLVVAYGVYVWRSIVGGGEAQEEESLDPLYLDRGREEPRSPRIVLQLAAGIGLIVLGAHYFVDEVVTISDRLGVAPIVLALVLAPLATELPEKFNSFIWMREGEDALALGNVTGAMVFQSTVPVSVGLLFTDWNLSRYGLVACGIALAGGALALWSIYHRRCVTWPAIGAWAGLFAGFVAWMVVAAT